MATVTGFTAARMLEIENNTVVSGEVVGDDLILTTHGGTPINAGDVRGPTGSPGVTELELQDALLGLSPVGSIVDYIGTAAPTKWMLMTGQTVVNGQSLYPALWSILPASMKSGSNIVMPDTRGRVTVGLDSSDTLFDAVGKTGGSKTAVLPQHSHTMPDHQHSGPNHNHTTPDHTHTLSGTATSAGAHTHANTFSIGGENQIAGVRHSHYPLTAAIPGIQVLTNEQVGGYSTAWYPQTGGVNVRWFTDLAAFATGEPNQVHTHPISGSVSSGGAHTHSLSGTAASGGAGTTGYSGTGLTGAAGAGSTSNAGESPNNANLQPFITFVKMIKVE